MSARPIAIGSRGSTLAMVQARLACEALERAGHPTRIVIVETDGDRRAPDTAWGEGAFVAAIERALLSGAVDAAVHSAKDIPTGEDPRLHIAAFLPRADPRDALVIRTGVDAPCLADLPRGFRVGTDSPRRAGFLRARRPDLVVHPLHGNVDTRLRRLDDGETDALVLACAGLDRLGLGDRIAERLEPEAMPPAPGQGAIAVQVRRDDARMLGLAATIDDRGTRRMVEAERSLLQACGGGCRAPIGALAALDGDELDLLAARTTEDGAFAVTVRRRGPIADGQHMGRQLAAELNDRAGAHTARWAQRPTRDGVPPIPRVLVTRAAGQANGLASALRRAGLEPVAVPTIAIELDAPGGDLDNAARHLGFYRWVVVTSGNGARALLKAAERVFTPFEASRFAAIGSATERALAAEGVDVAFRPSRSTAATLAAELPVTPGDRVLVVRGDIAGDEPGVVLRSRGAVVDDVIAYRTHEGPAASGAMLRAAVEGGPIAATTFTSGSTARGLLALGRQESIDVRSIPAVCIGAETADVAREAGFQVIATAGSPDSATVASAAAEALAVGRRKTS